MNLSFKFDNKRNSCEKGLTLIEVLAVIVILAIVAMIAIPVINKLIADSKNQAFVSTAFSMKEAVTMHYRVRDLVAGNSTSTTITYYDLENQGYIEPFKDPYTKTSVPDMSNSFVLIEKDPTSGKLVYKVRLVGNTKSICDKAPHTLTTNDIVDGITCP